MQIPATLRTSFLCHFCFPFTGDSIRLTLLPKSSDATVKALNTFVVIVFLLELMVMASAVEGYMYNFNPTKPAAARKSIGAYNWLHRMWDRLHCCFCKKARLNPSFYFGLDFLSTVMLLFDPSFGSYLSFATSAAGAGALRRVFRFPHSVIKGS